MNRGGNIGKRGGRRGKGVRGWGEERASEAHGNKGLRRREGERGNRGVWEVGRFGRFWRGREEGPKRDGCDEVGMKWVIGMVGDRAVQHLWQ